jgi:hypothetical protein
VPLVFEAALFVGAGSLNLHAEIECQPENARQKLKASNSKN